MTLNKTNPRYPLSSPQREIWFDQLRHANTPLYNIGGYMRIEGAIQPRLLEKAINQVVQENEALRTVLHKDAPLPTQSFPENVEVKVYFQDLSGEKNPHQHAIKWMENQLVKPFQLYEELLFKFALLKISPECYYGYSQYYHLIIDGWGISLIGQRVADTYNALLTHQPLGGEQTDYSYRYFIQSDQQYLTSEAYQRDEYYWRQKYRTWPEPVIPHQYANQFNETVPSQRQIQSIKHDLFQRLTAFSQKNHATTYHLILGVLYCYFIRTGNVEELVIGLSVLNRKTAAFKRTVGLFTSIIPTRFRFGTDLNFVDLIHAIGMELRQEYRHQRFPMSDIVKSVANHSQTPLFDIVMAYQKHDYPAHFAGKPAKVETLTNGFEHNTLFISVEEYQQNRDVRLTFDYQRDAFNEADMALFAARFEWILESILQKPNIPIWEINLIPDKEWRKIVKFNDTAQDYPNNKTIIDLFEEQVEQQPHHLAIVFQGQQLTYQELNTRANQLAYFLQTLGVQLETLVGLCVERSLEMVYGLLAILKAGGAYVPLDPSYPPERLAFMLADSQVPVLLTQQKLIAHLPESIAQIVLLDTEPEKQHISRSKRVVSVQPHNLAYVIYTSGSTGQPKGVLVEHGGLCNLITAQIQSFNVQPNSHILQFVSLSFDVSVSEMMMALGSGARLYLGTTDSLLPGTALIQQLREQRITHASFTPTTLAVSPLEELLDLQYLIVGGETCSPDIVAQWSKNRHFFNAYGPTEATVCATQFESTGEPYQLPIGRPIANTQIYLLDNHLQQVPIGVPGELHIGGVGLARCYLNRPELTADKFIPNLFSEEPGARLYKTGDLARYLPDGNIEYLDRIDHQVKVRGFRIELGEIEAQLSQHPSVRETAVICSEAPTSHHKRLVAYCVSEPDWELNLTEESSVDAEAETLSQWEYLFDNRYSQSLADQDLAFNIAGWNSSYTGLPIPAEEMHEWVDSTVKAILSLQPQHVLEIGCGSGLLLSRIAPCCSQYWGTDFSPSALQQVEQIKQTRTNLGHVKLFNRKADDFSEIEPESVDTLILNSVIQYFPSVTYLLEVLEKAIQIVKPGGTIFVGDVRSLPLLTAYHASVQFYQAADSVTRLELQQRVQQRVNQEEELVIDPDFFMALKQQYPQVTTVQIQLKSGHHHNELTRFRYDVMIQVGGTRSPTVDIQWQDWQTNPFTLATLRQQLENKKANGNEAKSNRKAEIDTKQGEKPFLPFKDTPRPGFGVRGVPNARLETEHQLLEWLANTAHTGTVGQLRKIRSTAQPEAIDPADLWQLTNELEYEIIISWAAAQPEGRYDVLFIPRTEADHNPLPILTPEALLIKPWHQYANNPLQRQPSQPIGPQLRQFLKNRLPDYMIPSAFVRLDSLPLTPNGKIDIRALSQLALSNSQLSEDSLVAPRTPEEELLADIWAEVLGLEQIGIHNNFFELGGHSLLATQLVSRIRDTFSIELPVSELFESPTIAGLTERLSQLRGLEPLSPLSAPTIQPIARSGELRLSFAQERLWFLDQLTPDNPYYNAPVAVRWKGELNRTALEQSLTEIIRRHETLRTGFQQINRTPMPVIQSFSQPQSPLSLADLQTLPEDRQATETQRIATNEARHPFDLKRGHLCRAILIKQQTHEQVLLITIHHIVTDGWSIGVLLEELSTLYKAFSSGQPSPLPELPIQYVDFAHWQRQWLTGRVLETQLAYWQQQLTDAPPVLEIPTDYPRPPIHTFRGGTEYFEITPKLTQQLNSLSQQNTVTLFMTSLAAFALLLERYTGQPDIVIGCPIASRTRQEIEPLIGFFINTLALRVDLSGNPTFSALLKQVRLNTLAAYAHQDLPFELLVESLQPDRDMTRNPLVQVALIFQNVPRPSIDINDNSLSLIEFEIGTVRFDLEFYLWEADGKLVGNFCYYQDLFESATIKRLLRHFQTLLMALAADPEQPISSYSLLDDTERHQLLVEWNQTKTDYPKNHCIHQLFEQQVEKTPDAIAVVFENQQVSYRELNTKANRLAHYLLKLGIKPEVLVGIGLERSVEMLYGLLAILKAGGSYVPFDPSYPTERLAFMLADSQVQVLLTQSNLQQKWSLHPSQIVCLDTFWAKRDSELSLDNPISGIMPSNLAYVIYTSGSTGQPKGVAIEHHSTVVLLNWAKQVFIVKQNSAVLASTSICFDLSIFEIFVPLSWGGSIILVENALHLPKLSNETGVTLVNTVPSAISELVRMDGIPDTVQVINLAGEPLKNELVQQIYQQPTPPKIYNLYGPSEDTTYSTFALMTNGDSNSPTIGRPIANTQVYILDRHLQPTPIGVVGELLIGGAGLARGYLNRPELTADKFLPNPFSEEPGARLYKTGDLARYLPDGNIEYLDRIDHQVKIRGFRIELGEIEAVLSQHPAILETVVICSEEAQPNNDKRLVAYCVSESDWELNLSEELIGPQLRQFLQNRLPDYMIPSAFVRLDSLPLTPNGKIDRRALSQLAISHSQLSEDSLVAPRTPEEELLADIWAEVLGLEQIGIHHNFFELGGHSLLATQLVSRIRDTFSVELPVSELFESPTIAGLTERLSQLRGLEPLPAITLVNRNQPIPLSFPQQRLWFLEQLGWQNLTYNQPLALRIEGSLHIQALAFSLREIVQRHETLRTTFPTVNGQAIQMIHSAARCQLTVVDLQQLTNDFSGDEAPRLINEQAWYPFDWSEETLFRSLLLKVDTQTHILLVTLHHLSSDGWSLGIFCRELTQLYQSFVNGEPVFLPQLPIQYADFTVWQRQWLTETRLETHLNYWQQQLAGIPAVSELPIDKPRPPIQTFQGQYQTFEIKTESYLELLQLSHENGATLFMTLFTALVILLFHHSGQKDIVVGAPIANRSRSEIEPLIGFFANTLVLRTQLSEEQNFTDILNQVRQRVLEAYAHQDVPLDKMVERVQPTRSLSYNPLFQVMLILQDQPLANLILPELTLTALELEKNVTAHFDLTLLIEQNHEQEQLLGRLVYNIDLFNADTIINFIGNFQSLLANIVASPKQRLSELTASLTANTGRSLAITATFTAEPLQDSLAFWIQALEWPFNVKFAPYNQVFQQLLDPSSLLSQNPTGINVVLVRFEDWICSKNEADRTAEIEQNVHELVSALKSAKQRSTNSYLVCVCPSSPPLYQQLEEWLVSELEPVNGLYLITTFDLTNYYPVRQYYDLHSDQLGHIPYTPAFFTALGTMIARKIHAIQRNPYKVIVLDCDGTLWQGVCAEDGPLGVKIGPFHQALQKWMVEQQAAGKLLCLCSKNRAEDVFAVFEQQPDLFLQRDQLVAWRINWLPKSENLKSLSTELQLGLDSFIFIDDSPIECAEVQARCPAVTTLQLPKDINQIPRFLEHIWAFDRLKITSEDQQRTQLYQQNIQRQHWQEQATTFADFLASLELDIQISAMTPYQINRVSQLTQRTNQFNFTTIRRSEAEIQQLCQLNLPPIAENMGTDSQSEQSGQFEGLVVDVKDRFGDYGLVGVMMFELSQDALTVDTFLLSCRALGRGVEHKMLAKLGEIAKERQRHRIEIFYRATSKNKPALDFLERVGGQKQPVEQQGWKFLLPVETVAELTYRPNVVEESSVKLTQPALVDDISSEARNDQVRLEEKSDDKTSSPYYSVLFNRIATEWCDAEQILTTIESQKPHQISQQVTAYVAPSHPVEDMLASILKEVLHIERIGVNDNFFELGGHSLLGVQVMSRIREIFSVELPLLDLFQFPHISGLSEQIQLAQREPQKLSAPPIQPMERNGGLQLSFAQERLWFLDQLTPDNPYYNAPMAVRWKGELNRTALEHSLTEIIRRHETLRTSFQQVNSNPVPVIHSFSPNQSPLSLVELQTLPEDRQTAEIQRIATNEAQRPFDLKQGDLCRAILIKQQTSEHVLLITIHHIVTDGWSIGVLLEELSTRYQAFSIGQPSPLPELPIQYADFAHWQRQWLTGSVLENQLTYWQQQLTDAPPVLEIPTDYPRPPIHTFRGGTEYFEITPKLTHQLNSLSQKKGVTLFMTSLTAFALLLERYTGQPDIVIGCPIANRTRKEIEPLIGFFTNTLALRVDLSENPTFSALLKQVRLNTLSAYAHQDLPFDLLVESLQPERDMTRNPLVQVALIFQNVPRPPTIDFNEIALSLVEFEIGTVRFDLEFYLWEADGKLVGNFCYYKDLFSSATIKRLIGHFQTLLTALAADPEQPISSYSLLDDAERHQLLVEWNKTKTDYPKDHCIHQLFEQQVEKTPDAIAVVFENQRVTYRELNTKANVLAHFLPKLGIQPEVLVGIGLERSVEMLYGLLAILKAGGAYVPFDPSYPNERLAFMLEDSQVQVLLTQSNLQQKWPLPPSQVICLDTFWDKKDSQWRSDNPISGITPSNLAYVIYTSGSTGQPKGVAIEHHSTVVLLNWAKQVFTVKQISAVLASTSICFDLSIFEIFVPLSWGGSIILVENALHLPKLSNETGVTLVNTVPSAISELIRMDGIPATVQVMNLAGEPLKNELVQQIYQQPNRPKIYNLYGPSEDTTYSTFALMTNEDSNLPTIGCPIANTQVYILDRHLQQPTPIGVVGELLIGGAGLARGYLNRPELTADKFLPNPFNNEPGARLYKTGDLARYLPDGQLDFLGRIDHQVKIRGFRIELAEIEAVLNQHPAVPETVVICSEETQANNDKRLIAYVVPNHNELLEPVAAQAAYQEAETETISQWEQLFDNSYNQSPAVNKDLTFNISGWNSSYTGLPIPAEEMREWVDLTVNAIMSLQPKHVLEIGCGTGLLLSRIAPYCSQYWGTDISPVALQQLEQLKQTDEQLEHVMLFKRQADELSDFAPNSFDTLIINSVIQYFPNVTYLLDVLEQTFDLLKPGGYLFIGDVRSLPLLKAYHASVQFYQAPDSLTKLLLQQRVQQQMRQEEELVIDPTFFVTLKQQYPQITQVQIQLKPGHHHNEMTRFRYDVILQLNGPISQSVQIPWQDWQSHPVTLSTLHQHLVENKPDIFGLRQVPNKRIELENQLLEWLANAAPTETVGQLRQTLSKHQSVGIDSAYVWQLTEELPYNVTICWSEDSTHGNYDVLFKHHDNPLPMTDYRLPISSQPLPSGGMSKPAHKSPLNSGVIESSRKTWSWHLYANNPLQGKQTRTLIPQLRQFLQDQLPEYMVPSAFVMLEAIPLTPNGKINRRALLALETLPGRQENYVAPSTETEQTLVQIWKDVLGLERIGIHDNFFELGGHSLLATQVMSRIQNRFSIELPLRDLFESPTVAALSEQLEKQKVSNPPTHTSTERERIVL